MYSIVREQRCKHVFVCAFFVTELQIVDVFAIRAFSYEFNACNNELKQNLVRCIFRCYFSFFAVAKIRRYERERFPNYQLSHFTRSVDLPVTNAEKRETTPFLFSIITGVVSQVALTCHIRAQAYNTCMSVVQPIASI